MNKKTKHIVTTLKTWRKINKLRRDKEVGTGKESFETTLNRIVDQYDDPETEYTIE